jgi:hypothetical protein
MDAIDDRLKDISEIRSLMEQSSKFLSLSGLSGISAGSVGLVAAGIAQWAILRSGSQTSDGVSLGMDKGRLITFFVITAFLTLIAALSLAAFFSIRMARKKGLPVWTKTAKSLILNLFVPLSAGGAFCFILLYHDLIFLIAPSMLMFYGLALFNTSKYTLDEIRYLGIIEICLGLIASIWSQFGLVFWGIGFGVLHIIYGTLMYFKYEK